MGQRNLLFYSVSNAVYTSNAILLRHFKKYMDYGHCNHLKINGLIYNRSISWCTDRSTDKRPQHPS